MPASGAPHRFTETLPRLHGGTGECLECERHYEAHEGPPTGRRFDYSTREIAYALVEVGKGRSDRSVGRDVRDRAGRLKSGKTPQGRRRRNKDGNTVADWVELYAPAVFAPHAAREWPRVVALDAKPFAVKTTKAGAPLQGGKNAFHVFGAYGWDRRNRDGRMLALKAMPNFGFNQGFPHWVNFLEELRQTLEGQMPFLIVCDMDRNILDAINDVWNPGHAPSPTVFYCHWHLAKSLRTAMANGGVKFGDPLLDAIAHESRPTCPCAFCSTQAWAAFEPVARSRKIKQVTNWMNRHAQRVAWQLDNRRKLNAQTSVGPLEQVLDEVDSAFAKRRGMIHNRERLDRRLMLMQLHLNHQARQSEYARVIREELLKRGGHGGPRYLVDDKAGSSLRIYP